MSESKPPYNFGGLAEEFIGYEKARAVVLPVPFDLTTSWMSGASQGPRALIEASGYLELYDIETHSEVYQRGIFTEEERAATSSMDLNEKVYERVRRHIQADKFVVTLGGEHSVAFGSAKAHTERSPKSSILHLDAHTDRREEFEATKGASARTFHVISELHPPAVSLADRSLDVTEL